MKVIINTRVSSNEQVKGTSLKDEGQKQKSMVAKHAFWIWILVYLNFWFCNHKIVANLANKKDTSHG